MLVAVVVMLVILEESASVLGMNELDAIVYISDVRWEEKSAIFLVGLSHVAMWLAKPPKLSKASIDVRGGSWISSGTMGEKAWIGGYLRVILGSCVMHVF
jgi:hypothetical protein